MIILKNKKKSIEIELDKSKIISANINGEIIKDDNPKLELSNGSRKMTLEEYVEKEKRDFYTNLLQNQYSEIENIVILSGAGSSVEIGEINKGLIMSDLWAAFEKEKKTELDTLIQETGFDSTSKNLELLLSEAGKFNSVKRNLDKEILEVKNFIVEKCTLKLPNNSPHRKFLDKITLRSQKYPRVKIFTLNYDTLFEQAARESMFTVIDGFTFSNPREFNGKYFDYDIIETRHNRQDKKDSTISKLFYLYKMHGSLSWQKVDNKITQADEKSIKIDNRVMVFPQDSKYEHSYEQPYFEMMARFQQALRTENTLLITIGFSFIDKHISSVILESLKQNPSLNLIAFSYPEVIPNGNEYQKELNTIAEHYEHVTLVAEKFEDLANEYPKNNAHKRNDIIEELAKVLKSKK
ncbi:SIR2 family protein [Flavobacterium sp. XS2P12]|uniref:SIR2 family protein n=1 Tax=Flavobacterium melibiosi TaxID=3398734 RepID=UPI003A85A145